MAAEHDGEQEFNNNCEMLSEAPAVEYKITAERERLDLENPGPSPKVQSLLLEGLQIFGFFYL